MYIWKSFGMKMFSDSFSRFFLNLFNDLNSIKTWKFDKINN